MMIGEEYFKDLMAIIDEKILSAERTMWYSLPTLKK